jgi:hypothetical protein
LLADNNLQIDKATHNVKTIIGGEIVGFEKEKPIVEEKKPVVMPGELDIY